MLEDKCRGLFLLMVERQRRTRTMRCAQQIPSAKLCHWVTHGSIRTDIGLRPRHSVASDSTNGQFCERQNSIILTSMPIKLKNEIVAAAIAGFEEQKKRLNAQIAELRQMLKPVASDSNPPVLKKRRRMSAAARAKIAAAQRKRWAQSRK